ncbi:MAG: hypothetical protein ACKVRO_09210 [Micropepsaceae bacterium]
MPESGATRRPSIEVVGLALKKKTIIWLDGVSFVSPEDFWVLEEAVKQAFWIVAPDGVIYDSNMRLVLAEGVVDAARGGERDLYELTLAACRYWFRSVEPKRAAHLRLVHSRERPPAEDAMLESRRIHSVSKE